MPIDERLIQWAPIDAEEQKKSDIDPRMVQWKPVIDPIKADPTEGMSALDKFRAGMGKAMYDTARGLGQYVGAVSRDDVKESRQRDKALMDTGWGTAGNFAGNAAIAAPTMMIPGANTVVGAGLIGAGLGLAQPSASTSETFTNAGVGGLAGAAVPAAMAVGRAGKAMFEPLYQSGRDQIMGRALRNAAGNQADDAMRLLQQGRQSVPGSLPTAAEVANNPGISAMQRTAVQTNPIAAGEMQLRQQANNQARIAALTGIAPDKTTAIAAREAATAPLYEQAKQATVQLKDGLPELLSRPAMKSAMQRAQQLAANAGESLDFVNAIPAQASTILNASGQPLATIPGRAGSMNGKAAHYLKMALDDMSNASPASGIAGNELRAIQGIRSEFMGALESQVPAYGQARQTYAAMSQPITAADIADALLAKSAGGIQGNMTPAAFNRALKDTTAKTVTGRANATLENTLTSGQMKVLNGIKDDLIGLDFANSAGRLGGGSDTVQKLAYSNLMDQAGIPSLVRGFPGSGIVGSIAQRFGDLAYTNANKQMADQLALSLLNPKTAAELMKKGTASKGLLMLQDAAIRGGLPLTGGLLGMSELGY